MKKLLTFLLAIFLMVGVASAASIPQSERATEGPGIWYLPVYNSDTTDLAAGDVVVWEVSASTGDNDNWVQDTTTADTTITAGVIWPSTIAVGDSGTMAIRGVVDCDINAGGVLTDSPLCTSTTAGEAKSCTTPGNRFGMSLAAGGSTTVKCYIGN